MMRMLRKPRKMQCGCVSADGAPKTWFEERWQASRSAGMFHSTENGGGMWKTYRCPESRGWHITSVRVDPWAKMG